MMSDLHLRAGVSVFERLRHKCAVTRCVTRGTSAFLNFQTIDTYLGVSISGHSHHKCTMHRPAAVVTRPYMIVAKTGRHFYREADGWRCIACPELLTRPRDRYTVAGRAFDSLVELLPSRRLKLWAIV